MTKIDMVKLAARLCYAMAAIVALVAVVVGIEVYNEWRALDSAWDKTIAKTDAQEAAQTSIRGRSLVCL